MEGDDIISSVFDIVSCAGGRDLILYVASGVMSLGNFLSINTYLRFSATLATSMCVMTKQKNNNPKYAYFYSVYI